MACGCRRYRHLSSHHPARAETGRDRAVYYANIMLKEKQQLAKVAPSNAFHAAAAAAAVAGGALWRDLNLSRP